MEHRFNVHVAFDVGPSIAFVRQYFKYRFSVDSDLCMLRDALTMLLSKSLSRVPIADVKQWEQFKAKNYKQVDM